MATTETKSAYTEKMQKLLREADGEVKKMEAQIAQVKADARAEHQQNVKQLRSKMAEAQVKLEQLRSEDEVQWEKTRVELERSWNDMKQSVQRTAAKLQQG